MTYDVAIVGAGILGLAVAHRLQESHPKCQVILFEKERDVASHQTGHNSGVVHSGIYYKPGSLKARLCVEGGKLLTNFCEENGVPIRRSGKVILATHTNQLPALAELKKRGAINGIEGLSTISTEAIKEIEPHAQGIQGLHVRSTAIVDFIEVSKVFARQIQNHGGKLHVGTQVSGINEAYGVLNIQTTQGDEQARYLINCAGLQSDLVARMAGISPPVRIIPFRGEYYKLHPNKRHLVQSLIYPVPDPRFPFLGVHLTRKISDEVEAGPNAIFALAREAYQRGDINLLELWDSFQYPGFWSMAKRFWKAGVMELHRSFSKTIFTKDLQKLVPELQPEDLVTGGSGVRAQAVDRSGALVDDFIISEGPRSIHVLNAPSPAATASMAIARYLVNLADQSFDLPI